MLPERQGKDSTAQGRACAAPSSRREQSAGRGCARRFVDGYLRALTKGTGGSLVFAVEGDALIAEDGVPPNLQQLF